MDASQDDLNQIHEISICNYREIIKNKIESLAAP